MNAAHVGGVPVGPRAADEIEWGRTTRYDLEIVVMSRRVEGGGDAGERPAERGDQALVGARWNILTGEALLPG